jgi:dTMP kinase
MTAMSGKLIVLEGIDGSGTTTQAARLGEWLTARGQQVLVTGEPSRGPVGALLRTLLKEAHERVDHLTLAMLFAADRIDHLAREIVPALRSGRHVVCDRYVLSSLAYQSLTLERSTVARLNDSARPADLTLLLDVPVDVAEARRLARGGAHELVDARETQKRVAALYRAEFATLPPERARVIDGTQPVEAVQAAIAAAVESCLLQPAVAS